MISEPIDPLLSVQLRHLGGALARPSDSAAGQLAEPYALYMFGIPSSPHAAAAVRTRQQEITQAIAPYLGARKPFTFLTPGETAAAAFTPGALERLRRIKRLRDPQGVFRSNFPVSG